MDLDLSKPIVWSTLSRKAKVRSNGKGELVVEGKIPLFTPHDIEDIAIFNGKKTQEVFREDAIDTTLFTNPRTPCVYCYNHDDDLPLASTRNNTLQVRKTDEGIEFVAVLNEGVGLSKDVYSLLRRNDVGGHSFKFLPEKYDFVREKNLLIYEKVKMFTDISCVSRPMYTDTEHKLRSIERCYQGNPKQTQNIELWQKIKAKMLACKLSQ